MKSIFEAGGGGYFGCGMGWLGSGVHMIGNQLGQLANRWLKNQYCEHLMNPQGCR